MQDKLASMDGREQEKLSRLLVENILASSLWQNCDALFIYFPVGSEPDLRPVLRNSLRAGKQVLLPRLRGREMDFLPLRAQWDKETTFDYLIKNRFGIPEPPLPLDDGRFPSPVPSDFSRPLMLIPGLAFTPGGDRLGRGGGYYDRYLGNVTDRPPLWGTAYPFQLCDSLPVQAHDITLDGVFTS